jgi:RNA polymerase sigma-70 factor, ECF subfamily
VGSAYGVARPWPSHAGKILGTTLLEGIVARAVAEREMIHQCVAGDPLACRALYQRYLAGVSRVVHQQGVAGVEADDLCQEIFLIVYRHLRNFRGEGRLRTWINRLASREAARFARRRDDRQLRLRTRLRLRPRPRPTVENEAPHRRYLDQLLASLPPERRLPLVLFEIEGRLVDEIAEICGCAVNTVWTRIHRARAQLARLAREGNA